MTAAALVAAAAGALAAQAARVTPELLTRLPYRHIGPVGNRVPAVAGVPGDPNVYYAGGASGGVWKTEDGGAHWAPVFDDQPVQSIGALAVAPSDSNIVWAGTGEDCIRSNISIGNGIYKSTDAGQSWTHMGLDRTGRVGRIVIDPRNPDTVMACAVGHGYGPQPERGVFRTTDGGKTWARTLFVDERTGCSDIARDPNDPDTLFAGMWQFEMATWGRESGGPGSGLFKSTDGGVTWSRLSGRGLPTRPVGKIAVAMPPSNPNAVYAVIETGDGVPWKGQETDRGTLWRSNDRGATWTLTSYDHKVNGRAHYYTHVAVAPDNEHELFFLTGTFARSLDGGKTVRDEFGLRRPGGDNHDIWIDPKNGDRMIVGNDFGVSVSVNRGATWWRIQLPIAQMYHVMVDNQVPYNVYGNRQDGPSFRGPSNSRLGEGGSGPFYLGGRIPRSMWDSVGGGESGWATPDPVDSNIVWSSSSGSGSGGGAVARWESNRRQARAVEVWPDQTNGWPAADLKYRFYWQMPLTISPHDRNTLYVGSQHVHQTANGGQSWQVISPDLTLNDKSRQQISGGLTPDNIGPEYGGTLFSIAESRLEKGLIWAGSNDGLVHVTRDGGKSWTNVTANVPDLPVWGTVSSIEPSRYHAPSAYMTVDFHQVNNRDPFVYRTTDYGRTWRKIVNGIPRSMLSYAHVVREDPVRRGLLYLGTENALYVSFDDGENWMPLQANMPHAPVYWLVVQEHFNDLVVATYGRGYWILDDITPLQQLSASVLESSAHLFVPRPAYRFRAVTAPSNHSANHADDPAVGQNPPYGASISYYLKSVPAGDVTIEIKDAKGQRIRTLPATKHVGINRLWWDLRYEDSNEFVQLRTSPLYAPEVGLGPEGFRTQPLPEGGRIRILAPPGTYTVELSVGGQKLTQSLTVKKDPHSGGSEADIQRQMTMLFELRRELASVVRMVNQIEETRRKLLDLAGSFGRSGDGQSARAAAEALNQKLVDIEGHLIELKLTGEGQDTSRWPARLVSKMMYLANGLAGGDFPPTSQQMAVHQELKKQIAAHQRRYDDVLATDLPAFNRMLQARGLQAIEPGAR
ncbi:MAG: sialidase [Vicinamibacterales bacterium]